LTWEWYVPVLSVYHNTDREQICASAPVLRPLLAKIPFSLSETFSRGISIKKSGGYASNTQTPHASQNIPSVSATSSSKRRLEAPTNVLELANDKGHSFESKHWTDAETGLVGDNSERGSQHGILEDDTPPVKGIARLWDKIRTRNSGGEAKEDMTITRTSEVELQIGPATRRSSRQEKHGDLHEAHMPLPPLTPVQTGHDR
jgi:hypothetical protein